MASVAAATSTADTASAALCEALLHREPAGVAAALAAGADPDATGRGTFAGDTPLMLAARVGDPALVWTLLGGAGRHWSSGCRDGRSYYLVCILPHSTPTQKGVFILSPYLSFRTSFFFPFGVFWLSVFSPKKD